MEYDVVSNAWRQLPAPTTSGERTVLAIQRIEANRLMLTAVGSNGAPYTYLRVNGAWQPENALGGGVSTTLTPALLNWEAGETVFLSLGAGAYLYAKNYTAYQQALTWQNLPANIEPMPLAGNPANHYTLAHKNGTPYLVWLEKSPTGVVSLRSRANPLNNPLTNSAYYFSETEINGIALVSKDLLSDDFDRIVVAFMTQKRQISVYVFDPQDLSVPIAQTGPGPVIPNTAPSLIALDAGDLDGDGRRNEIAVSVLGGDNSWRYTLNAYRFQDSTVNLISTRQMAYYTNYYYNSVAVTIGAFDPNTPTVEQVVVGAVNVRTASPIESFGNMALFRLNGSELDYVAGSPNLSVRQAVIWGQIDLHAVDLNGDGIKEIAASVWMPASSSELFTLAFSGTSLLIKDTMFDANGPGQRIEVGDLNGDGQEEVIGWYGKLRIFRQKVGGDVGKLTVATQDTILTTPEFLVGDVNNDSVSMVADGCEDFRELTVLQVLNAPPRWYPTQGAGAAFAKSAYSGSSEGSTTSSTLGGSLTVGFDYEQDAPLIGTKIGGVRASVTQDFAFANAQSKENAATETWTTTYEFDEGEGGNGQTGMVIFSQTKFRCYFFRRVSDPEGARSMKVCSHLGVGSTNKPRVSKVSLEQWRSDSFRSSAGTSWAEVGAPTNKLLGANGYLTKLSIPPTHFPVVKQFADSVTVIADVFPGKTTVSWDTTQDTTTGTESSWETNTTISAGVTAGTLTVDGSFSFGFSGSKTSSTTLGSGQTLDAKFYDYDPTVCNLAGIPCLDYTVKPYVYLRTVKTLSGETYQVYELDYYLLSVAAAAT